MASKKEMIEKLSSLGIKANMTMKASELKELLEKAKDTSPKDEQTKGIKSETSENLKAEENIFMPDGTEDVNMIRIEDSGFKKPLESELSTRELVLSMHNDKAILTGEVIGVSEPKRYKGKKKNYIYYNAIVKYKDKKIKIPSPLFFRNIAKISEDKVLELLQKYIGAEVDFTVLSGEDIETPYPIFIGSRKEGMRRRALKEWFRKNKDGSYRIQEQSIVEARVVLVATRFVIVDVFGIETTIYKRELTHEYINDARDNFVAGDIVRVRVTDIQRKIENDKPKITYTASIKRAIPDPRIVHFEEYNVGQTCKGVVTNVNLSDKGITFFVNVNGEVDVLCWLKAGITLLPVEGDTVSIKIARKYEKENNLTGTITHVDAKQKGRY